MIDGILSGSPELAADLWQRIDTTYPAPATVRPTRGRQRERRPAGRSTRARRTASAARDDSSGPEPPLDPAGALPSRTPHPANGTGERVRVLRDAVSAREGRCSA